MKIILYSNNCPRCKVLKTKLEQKKVVYTEINDVQIMRERDLGKEMMPLLEVDGVIYKFKDAVDWVNEVQNEY